MPHKNKGPRQYKGLTGSIAYFSYGLDKATHHILKLTETIWPELNLVYHHLRQQKIGEYCIPYECHFEQ